MRVTATRIGDACPLDKQSFSPCCAMMDDATEGPIQFLDRCPEYYDQAHPKLDETNLPCFALAEVDPGWYGDSTTTYWPIKACPFCGEKIELTIKKG